MKQFVKYETYEFYVKLPRVIACLAKIRFGEASLHAGMSKLEVPNLLLRVRIATVIRAVPRSGASQSV